MKRSVFTLALLAALVLAVGTGCGSKSKKPAITKSAITVNANAEIKAKPDMVSLSFGVSSRGSTASEALRKNSAAMRHVIAVIKREGVAPRDIQTQSFDVNPTYSHSQVTGYEASNTVSVDLHKISRTGALITRVTAAGSNLEGGLSFSQANSDLTYRNALTKALAKARAKAETIASGTGLSLGKPLSVKEGGSSVEPYYMNYNMAFRAAALYDAVPIQSGRVSTSASVTVVYSAS